ncbi:unnamed protein product [Danaus chrysippus]|uniref:(African queen) hypothetical protein n=1 Tax=Danaus chrysippus TaxID=151541 RepID=A0A8J2R2Z0_9NEOP|nr:unnamed protein product [Danaus chrysippus]
MKDLEVKNTEHQKHDLKRFSFAVWVLVPFHAMSRPPHSYGPQTQEIELPMFVEHGNEVGHFLLGYVLLKARSLDATPFEPFAITGAV